MPIDISKSIDACAAYYGEDGRAVKAYIEAGQAAALALPNRGPIRFDKKDAVHPEILDAYADYGFYIFEDAIGAPELTELQAAMDELRTRFPVHMGAEHDAQGRPALGTGQAAPTLLWAKPLSDPLGGTPIANGRHQVKLFEPTPEKSAPPATPFYLAGSLQHHEALLRLYAHPGLLKVAEAVNGPDFAPFHEGLFIKDAGLGAAVSWHQDGDTHWESAGHDQYSHGFNFQAQLYGSTAVNGVWVLPGSQKEGRINIVERNQSRRHRAPARRRTNRV